MLLPRQCKLWKFLIPTFHSFSVALVHWCVGWDVWSEPCQIYPAVLIPIWRPWSNLFDSCTRRPLSLTSDYGTWSQPFWFQHRHQGMGLDVKVLYPCCLPRSLLNSTHIMYLTSPFGLPDADGVLTLNSFSSQPNFQLHSLIGRLRATLCYVILISTIIASRDHFQYPLLISWGNEGFKIPPCWVDFIRFLVTHGCLGVLL